MSGGGLGRRGNSIASEGGRDSKAELHEGKTSTVLAPALGNLLTREE